MCFLLFIAEFLKIMKYFTMIHCKKYDDFLFIKTTHNAKGGIWRI